MWLNEVKLSQTESVLNNKHEYLFFCRSRLKTLFWRWRQSFPPEEISSSSSSTTTTWCSASSWWAPPSLLHRAVTLRIVQLLVFIWVLFNPCVMMVLPSLVQERAADDSKEVEGFQQLLLARTQVINTGEFWEIWSPAVTLPPFTASSLCSELWFQNKCNYSVTLEAVQSCWRNRNRNKTRTGEMDVKLS